MRDLSMEELGHVYGAGGKSKPYYCKEKKGGSRSRSRSYSRSRSRSHKKNKDKYCRKQAPA